MHRARFCWLMAVVVTSLEAAAQNQRADSPSKQVPSPRYWHASLLSALTDSHITLQFDQKPLHEAIDALSKQIGAPILARYADHNRALGLNREQPISLSGANRSGLSVLEDILEQAAADQECTWQLRRGFIEVGTKERLAVPAARVLLLYPITDLMLEPPKFDSNENPWVRGVRGPDVANPLPKGELRQQPMGVAVKIIETVGEMVEPGRWDYGQPMLFSEDGQPITPFDSSDAADQTPPAAQPPAQSLPPWATVRLWRGHMVIIAPDFMHRQIGGYAHLSEAEMKSLYNGLPPDPKDTEKAKLLGVLVYAPVTVNWNEINAQEAFAALADMLGVTIIGRYRDGVGQTGIDPQHKITMTAHQRPAIDVLEELLERCEDLEDCTWQIRKGAIEVGTKRRLAARPFHEARRYELTDQLLEPHYFINPKAGEQNYEPVKSPYLAAVLGAQTRTALRKGKPVPDKSATDILLELAELFVETVEPGQWNVPGNRRTVQTTPPQTLRRNYWATLKFVGPQMFITAPDFIHRQIGAYPRPLPPAGVATHSP